MEERKKDLEVVTGDDSSLDISPVYEHVSAERPQRDSEKPKNIVIPETNRKERNEKEEKPNE